MAPSTVSAQRSLQLALMSLTLIIFNTNGSPHLDRSSSDENACPSGWLRYERFCLARGKGDSDRAVALYCDGFGGIGIKGLCITRAYGSSSGSPDSSPATHSIFGELTPTHDGLCPEGWTHYRRLCVYKPVTIAEQCHSMDSVDFSGLCIKHAKLESGSTEEIVAQENAKRVCCCADPRAKQNRYGC